MPSRYFHFIAAFFVAIMLPWFAHGQDAGRGSSNPDMGYAEDAGTADARTADAGPAHAETQADASADDDASPALDEPVEQRRESRIPLRETIDEAATPIATPRTEFDPTTDSVLQSKSREELESEGFVFADTSQLASSSSATLMALTVGSLVHGVGHIYLGDIRTGTALLAAETFGLVAMIGSGLFVIADGGAGTVTGIAAPVFQLGLGTFMTSWFLDVIGSVQGESLSLPRSTRNRDGIEFEMAYGFISAAGTPIRHALQAGLNFDFDLVRIEAETVQDVLLSGARYQALVGTRLFRVRPQTFLWLAGVGDLYQIFDEGAFSRLGAEARVGGSLDLGVFFSQFADVAVGTWVGYGNHFFAFREGLELSSFDMRSAFVSYKTFFTFNVSEQLSVGYGYGSHPGDFLTPSSRLLGVSEFNFDYLADFGSFRLKTEIGDGVTIWVGGALEL